MGPLDSLPAKNRLHSSDAGEPKRLRGRAGLRSPHGDSDLPSRYRTPVGFLGACMDPTEDALGRFLRDHDTVPGLACSEPEAPEDLAVTC